MNQAKQDGTTSVKVHHAPGGKSNFSLAWDQDEAPPVNRGGRKPQQEITMPVGHQQKAPQQQQTQGQQPAAGKTSVKVHNPPGGKSNFTLG